MKCKVQMYRSGVVFEEEYQAKDYKQAREIALARNPGVTIIGVTAVFK